MKITLEFGDEDIKKAKEMLSSAAMQAPLSSYLMGIVAGFASRAAEKPEDSARVEQPTCDLHGVVLPCVLCGQIP